MQENSEPISPNFNHTRLLGTLAAALALWKGLGMLLLPRMHKLAQLDHQYLWHPFTQMRDWLRHEPIIIVEGEGAILRDVHGREYLDANSSIWTNLHGHKHPEINGAIQGQLGKIAHSSALGLANEPASLLAARLVQAVNKGGAAESKAAKSSRSKSNGLEALPRNALSKVFFSDDGSTAVEVALKLAYEYARRTGRSRRPRFLSVERAYHGDTIGAVSLGHIDLFHKAYSGLLFKSNAIPAPYCYRCRFNRAVPERADAREYRKCNWECLQQAERSFATQRRQGNPVAALVVEPMMQGAAGMIAQPRGWFKSVANIARHEGAQLIADEVMTGFGRTVSSYTDGSDSDSKNKSSSGLGPAIPLFACQQEGVTPDFLAVAKGMTGGYLPMAATLTTQAVFEAFLGEYTEFKTFFHGHSFTGNQLGAAAGLASLDLLQAPGCIRRRAHLEKALRTELRSLWELPNIGDIRQVGLVVGIELVRDWRTREAFDLRDRVGIKVCEAMARRGVLTRPIGNVLVVMPPYCTTSKQLKRMMGALAESVAETCRLKG